MIGSKSPDFNLILISSWIEFWFVKFVPKYFNSSTLSKELLSIFILWLCPAFWSRDMTMYLVLSACICWCYMNYLLNYLKYVSPSTPRGSQNEISSGTGIFQRQLAESGEVSFVWGTMKAKWMTAALFYQFHSLVSFACTFSSLHVTIRINWFSFYRSYSRR